MGTSLVRPNRTGAASRGLQTLFHAGSFIGVTDGQLLERSALRDGQQSETAFAALVDRHGPLVWRTCRAVLRDEHEAADAFQATFLVLVRKAGSLWVRDSIAPWLHRVALRAANHARRAAKRRKDAERRAAELKAGWTETALPDDLADILHQVIDRLPERHRIVIILCDLEERSSEEAARHMRCPVGTVKSRLARARARVREALIRRGVVPAAVPVVTSLHALAVFESPPQALTASTIRGSVLFALDTNMAAGVVSKTAILLAEGVVRAMIRAKLQSATLLMLATFGLLVPAWLAHARQAPVDPAQAKAPAAGRKIAVPAVDFEGNWIVRVYPGGQAAALIGIEGPPQQPHATLLSVGDPKFSDLARSKVEHLRIDERTVRFTLQRFFIPRKNTQSIEIIAHAPEDKAKPQALRGSWIEESGGDGTQTVLPVVLERTDRVELNSNDWATEPSWEAFTRNVQTEDLAKKKEALEGRLARHGETPSAPVAAWALAINRADAGAPGEEMRALIDQTARFAARHGREMEIGAVNLIINRLIGAEEREDLILEYARKTVAMLHPDDSAALQIPTLKNLAAALRKAIKIDKSKAMAEARALDERIATLARRAGHEPVLAQQAETGIRSENIPWARNFAAARKQARAEGKLILLEFYKHTSDWCKRLDAQVFPSPAVAEAMRRFVPVKVDANDGEGRPLAGLYRVHTGGGSPAILCLDPAVDDPKDARIVGKFPFFMLADPSVPADNFADQLHTIAHLPRDVDSLMKKAHPNDGDAMRQLATALAMQGRVNDAVSLIDRAWGPGADPNFDRWAAVYNTLGDTLMLPHLKLAEAAEWYTKAARVAKRPIDIYNARLGAGLVASIQRARGVQAARELEAAAQVDDEQ